MPNVALIFAENDDALKEFLRDFTTDIHVCLVQALGFEVEQVARLEQPNSNVALAMSDKVGKLTSALVETASFREKIDQKIATDGDRP
jgi:hypothetical protein